MPSLLQSLEDSKALLEDLQPLDFSSDLGPLEGILFNVSEVLLQQLGPMVFKGEGIHIKLSQALHFPDMKVEEMLENSLRVLGRALVRFALDFLRDLFTDLLLDREEILNFDRHFGFIEGVQGG